ncbi:MAG: PASTA domain-containing protein [Sphingobacteriales bacterium]|nr:PASTA domain-containing protein [Sphingobacteriales bacterium]
MFEKITKRSFLFNVLIAGVVSFLVILIFLFSLDFFTNHGQSKTVPEVKGKNLTEAIKVLEAAGFDAEVTDSVYFDTIPGLQITRQLPDPGELVKVNRVVYLTVNRMVPPIIDMPNLVGQSEASALMILKALGLRLGDTIMKPDFAKGSVLQQLKDDNDIKPGTKLQMGSSIDLVIGAGIADESIIVPDLIGLTFADAKVLLESNKILMGAVVPKSDVTDTMKAYIYDISPGQLIDVYLSNTMPVKDTTAVKKENE